MITSTSGTSTTAQSAVSTSAAAATAQGDRFLKLLVAQMKNQDPLNPMDNAQVTTQMAQISTVSGIEKLNQTLQAFTQAQGFQAVGMIGRSVVAPGDFIDLAGGSAAAGMDLPAAADSVKVNIVDGSGNVLRTMNLGKKDAGVSVFTWDGKDADGNALADGSYGFSVDASVGGKSVAPVSLSVGKVSSVLMDATGPSLTVSGMGAVSLSSVYQVL